MSRAFFVVECILVIAMLLPTTAAQAQNNVKPLTIGDQFPPIGKRANWLKGPSVESYSKGKVYVIDLWATWCAPCIEMMPHTSNIADRYAKHGVEIIGLALDPGDATGTQQFVKTNPNMMRYAICEDIDGQLKTEYMTRTGTAGIPTVLIINQDGMLAWKGHPKNMGGPLAEIVLETYDLEAAKRTLNRHAAATENIANPPATATDRDALRNIFERKDGNAMVKLAESMMGNKTRLVNALGIKGKGLYHQGKFEEAKSTFTSICNESGQFKTQVLCGAAEFLVTEYQDNPERNLSLAISLAEAAVATRTGQQWPASGTLVLVMDVVEFHLQGNKKGEVESHKFFAQKLMQYETLRNSKPKESRLTARNRRTLLGQ